MTSERSVKEALGGRAVIEIATRITSAYPPFPAKQFVRAAVVRLSDLPLFARADHIADRLADALPTDIPEAVAALVLSLGPRRSAPGYGPTDNFRILPLTRFISRYGRDHLEVSLKALYEMTCRFTAEFDIRPFIERYPDQTMGRLREWSGDPNVHVRRLVSEGTRPRLPWANHLEAFKRDPRPVLELLDLLKDDPERYVQKSVGNSMADILKDNPETAYETLEGWAQGGGRDREWIIRHAVRFQRERGEPRALRLSGLAQHPKIRLTGFRVLDRRIELGGLLRFRCRLKSTCRRSQRVQVGYALRPKGKSTPGSNRYRLFDRVLGPGEGIEIDREHALLPRVTRPLAQQAYYLELMANGTRIAEQGFSIV